MPALHLSTCRRPVLASEAVWCSSSLHWGGQQRMVPSPQGCHPVITPGSGDCPLRWVGKIIIVWPTVSLYVQNDLIQIFYSFVPELWNADLSAKNVQGRIPGGVAVLWNKKYVIQLWLTKMNVDWAIGLEINNTHKRIIIINIYMPYKSNQWGDDFLNRLHTESQKTDLHSFIEGYDSTCVYIIGDFNYDLSDNN